MISVLSVAILIHLHVDIWLILILKFEIQLEIFYREKFTDHADPSDVFLSFYQEHETILWLVEVFRVNLQCTYFPSHSKYVL